jgi:Ca2+-transporting ATPase
MEVLSAGTSGLGEADVLLQRSRYGRNEFSQERKNASLRMILDILREPMFILLLLSCCLYFILGESGQGMLMLVAMLFVAAISWYQEMKSTHALKALRQLTEPGVTVIRDGRVQVILAGELVPGDVILVEEGNLLPADATILDANDLSVNESILTGESAPADKAADGDNLLFQGTTVNSGRCMARVTATGNATRLGRLGRSITFTGTAKTMLQMQITRVVKVMAVIGAMVFAAIWILNYYHTGEVLTSLLFALTLAMAIIPEEIPVAFSSFMALGAYRMARLGIITRQPVTIENLGRVSVICLDKTGTITENRMKVVSVYDYARNTLMEDIAMAGDVLSIARLASERSPFDAMEKAIVEAYEQSAPSAKDPPPMVHEYPLGGRPPLMTHVYPGPGEALVTGKGAPERVLRICGLDGEAGGRIKKVIADMASLGYRVLGIARARHRGAKFPDDQDAFDWQFVGLVALYDPPKAGVRAEFDGWRQAGIKIRLVTGDYKETARQMALQVGLPDAQQVITGDEVMNATAAELTANAKTCSVFARMFPEAKLRLVETLEAAGETVAMVGDGVNDGPALKAAHIGIAMGGKGAEIARQAADLVLTDDKLERVTEAIRQGRKIYYNLKKAVRYIFSIHIPILLIATLPVLLDWRYPNIFTPVHIIFFELIMGPTCSVFFENEPVEPGMMTRRPRARDEALFSFPELGFNFVQGCIIAAGILALYHYFMTHGYPLTYVRSMVFLPLMIVNLLLTFTGRSFEEGLLKTLHYRNDLVPYVVGASILFLASVMAVPFLRDLFGLHPLRPLHYLLCVGTSMAVTLWFEGHKTLTKKNKTL